MAKLTQRDVILRHLNDYGTLTSMEAINEYGIMRLASRISELRAQGYRIRSEIQVCKNRYGESNKYAVYSLAK